jgi:hypothetical protein
LVEQQDVNWAVYLAVLMAVLKVDLMAAMELKMVDWSVEKGSMLGYYKVFYWELLME